MITTLVLLAGIVILDLLILAGNVLVISTMLLLIAYNYHRRANHDWVYYIIAMVLVFISLFYEIKIIESGIIAFGMMNVVLFTGVLPDEWTITKRLRSYRALYSILGVILALPHAYINLFVDKEIDLFGVAALVIMLPLFITSFNLIKKEIKREEWVKLQRASYIVYILLFLHLIVVADPYGKIVYAVLMTLYINNKLVKEFHP